MIDGFNLRQLLAWIAEQDLGAGLLLIGAGLIFLIFGWRLSRVMITLSLAIMSAAVALYVVPTDGWDSLWLALAVAILGGYLGVRSLRSAVVLTSGGWAAFLMLGAMVRLNTHPSAVMIVGVVTFVAVGAMAFAAVRPCVAFVTSIEGTMLLLTGLAILLADFPSYWGYLRDAVENNPVFIPFILVAGTVTGYYLQLADMQQKESGLSPS